MEGLSERVSGLLDAVQTALLERAVEFRDSHTIRTASSDEFRRAFEGRPGFVIAPWCGSADCEARIKAETQATIRNLAFDLPPATGACVRCGRPGLTDAYFAKSY
jgi:prolyl-tRNA synthetase